MGTIEEGAHAYDQWAKATKLAFEWHKSSKREDGSYYVLHSLKVADGCEKIREKTVAMLHDILEDTGVGEAGLLGIDRDIIETVKTLTRRDGEDYPSYIMRVKKDQLAAVVKIQDLKHNLESIYNIKDEVRREMLRRRYLEALDELEEVVITNKDENLIRFFEEKINTVNSIGELKAIKIRCDSIQNKADRRIDYLNKVSYVEADDDVCQCGHVRLMHRTTEYTKRKGFACNAWLEATLERPARDCGCVVFRLKKDRKDERPDPAILQRNKWTTGGK